MDCETVDRSNFKLDQLLEKVEDTIVYYYDFSEGWEHTIRVENILPFNTRNNRKLPVCTAGKRGCPPENCGGMEGYYYLLKALGDPTHPEHGEMSEWVGVGINPEYFEIDEINEALDERFP